MSGVRGRWFITPHAVQRFIARIKPWLDYEDALDELITDSYLAHHVKRLDSGAEQWRGAPPLRLRYVVTSPANAGDLPVLVSILPCNDGAAQLKHRDV